MLLLLLRGETMVCSRLYLWLLLLQLSGVLRCGREHCFGDETILFNCCTRLTTFDRRPQFKQFCRSNFQHTAWQRTQTLQPRRKQRQLGRIGPLPMPIAGTFWNGRHGHWCCRARERVPGLLLLPTCHVCARLLGRPHHPGHTNGKHSWNKRAKREDHLLPQREIQRCVWHLLHAPAIHVPDGGLQAGRTCTGAQQQAKCMQRAEGMPVS